MNSGGITTTLIPCTGTATLTVMIDSNDVPHHMYPLNTCWIEFGDGKDTTVPFYSTFLTAPITVSVTHHYAKVGQYSLYVHFKGANNCLVNFDGNITVPLIPQFKVISLCNSSNTMLSTVKDLSQVLFPPASIIWGGKIVSSPMTITTPPYKFLETMSITDVATPTAHTCFIQDSFSVPKRQQAAFIEIPWANQCELTPILFNDTTHNVIGREWSFEDISTRSPFVHFYSNLKNPKEAFNYGGTALNPWQVSISLSITDDKFCTSTATMIDTTLRNTMNGISLTTAGIHCLATGDTITVNVQKIVTIPSSAYNTPFHFVWHSGREQHRRSFLWQKG